MSVRLPFASATAMIVVLATAEARARHCGSDDCGDHGTCRESSLIAKCDCDEGYASVLTHLSDGSQGAYCVPLPGRPEACEGLDCTPHGVCTDSDDAGARCLCDPGYRPDSGQCVDDPADDAERACDGVECGSGGTCMATEDAITCRCAPGDLTLLGRAADGGFGPVCATPANPDTACGPDACGPYGECVLSQAAFCRCEPGASVEELVGPDGRGHPYCVDPHRPLPDGGALPDAGGPRDAGPVVDASADGDENPHVEDPGCSCRVAHQEEHTQSWLASLASVLGALRRRRNTRIRSGSPKKSPRGP